MKLEFTDKLMQQCQAEFNKLEPQEAIFYTHYDFAERTGIKDPGTWKMFLTNPNVSDWMQSEVETIRQVQLRRVLNNASDESRSVGVAQMITALNKVSEGTKQKTGPIFIYCSTPLNDREKNSPYIERSNPNDMSEMQ